MAEVIFLVSYVEVVVVMDKQGRILIPRNIRRNISSTVFLLELEDDGIKLKPINVSKLTSFIDKIAVEIDDFTDTHKLREALYGEER